MILSLKNLNDENFKIVSDDVNVFFIDAVEETFESGYTGDYDNRHLVDMNNTILVDKVPTKDSYDEILNNEVMIKCGDNQVLRKMSK